MASSFAGLSTAVTALHAQRRSLDIAGQNIANANTEGYSRQRVDLQSIGGTTVPAIWSTWQGAGAGVTIADVVRVRDAFLDARNRTEHAANAFTAAEQQAYGQVEQLVTEPSDTGLQAQLADVWAAWHDVANSPGDLAARSALLQQASTAADSLNSRHEGLGALWSATRDQLDALVTDVNTAAAAIADLNQSIVAAQAAELPSNELADQRDQLILNVADLVGATTRRHQDGSVDVLVAGSALVSGSSSRQLVAVGARRLEDQAAAPAALRWRDSGSAATVPSGQIASAVQTLGTTVPRYSDALDQVAARLASTVNAQHAAGYTLSGAAGGAFFAGTTAATIAVAVTNPAAVAASATPGGNLDGSNADALAALATVAGGADLTYRQLVAGLGATTHSVNQRAAIQARLTEAAGSAVASTSGVSLDEEMTNMLTYQRAYQAAARVVSTIDSVLDTLINHTGL
jgi:flagellar hook-associated protein 1 FlgK